jgi:hypothetical protein
VVALGWSVAAGPATEASLTLRVKQGIGVALALGVAALAWTWLSASDATHSKGEAAQAPNTDAPRAVHAPRAVPRKPVPGAAANAAAVETATESGAVDPESDSTDEHGDVTPASSQLAGAGAAPTRVEQLRMAVLQQAVRKDWVSVSEEGAPCPPQQLRILYGAPSDLARYTKGAYFEPLGPEPSNSTDEINGLLICEGYTHLYRGFEAFYRADRDQWDVFPFPVIE